MSKKAATKEKQSVRCKDCIHAGPMVDLVCRCRILGIGKVGNARRCCENYVQKI